MEIALLQLQAVSSKDFPALNRENAFTVEHISTGVTRTLGASEFADLTVFDTLIQQNEAFVWVQQTDVPRLERMKNIVDRLRLCRAGDDPNKLVHVLHHSPRDDLSFKFFAQKDRVRGVSFCTNYLSQHHPASCFRPS